MKKVILTVVAIFTFGFANAQDASTSTGGKGFQKGDVFLSGTVAFGSTKNGGIENTSLQVTPKLGFFVAEKFAIGPQIGYATTTETKANSAGAYEKERTNAIQLGAFARYYGMPASDFSFFVELGANYSSATTDPEVGNDVKTNGFNIRLAPGFNYFVSDHIAIEASIGALSYETSKADNASDSRTSFGLNVNSANINFGLVYKF